MISDFLSKHRAAAVRGFKDGIPIGLGYLAVSFSLGIVASNAGLSVFQSFLISAMCNASAGEYAGIMSIAADSTYFEIVVVMLITNIRYLLMSCALSQRIAPGTRLHHRLIAGFYLTDELFGISVAGDGYLDPFYMYGAVSVAAPGWAFGTALGALAGNILPVRIVSALSVALYGMFLAIIIPHARKSKVVSVIILICFVVSYGASKLPIVSELTSGTRTVILTVIISAAAALIFPRDESEERP